MIAQQRTRPRAFILERVKAHNVSKAQRHGDLVDLFTGGDRPSLWMPEVSEAIIARLSEFDFDPDVDFIIVSGSMLMVAVGMAAIGATYGAFRALCYDSRSQQYSPIEVGGSLCTIET